MGSPGRPAAGQELFKCNNHLYSIILASQTPFLGLMCSQNTLGPQLITLWWIPLLGLIENELIIAQDSRPAGVCAEWWYCKGYAGGAHSNGSYTSSPQISHHQQSSTCFADLSWQTADGSDSLSLTVLTVLTAADGNGSNSYSNRLDRHTKYSCNTA